jgi:hypothetical protein
VRRTHSRSWLMSCNLIARGIGRRFDRLTPAFGQPHSGFCRTARDFARSQPLKSAGRFPSSGNQVRACDGDRKDCARRR